MPDEGVDENTAQPVNRLSMLVFFEKSCLGWVNPWIDGLRAKLKFSTQSKLNILEDLTLEKSYHSVLAFLVIRQIRYYTFLL